MERRHPAFVRVTHWINAAVFVALLVSGVAILLAHPRLYWGETGALGGPSLLDLPLPMLLTGQSGWGRYLHFLAAWACIFNGLTYVAAGTMRGHFRALPYRALQRRTYVVIVFVLLPLMLWTGLAMSPAITSVMPLLVTTLGGQQSARTIHFFVAAVLVLFAVGHVGLVTMSGFLAQTRGMITGGAVTTESV